MRQRAAKTQMILARIDPKLKRSAEVLNAETVAAMTEANDPATLRPYRNFRELREKA